MISFAMIAFMLVALGVLVLLAGILLLIKRSRLAGALVALLGVGLISFPVLTLLYVSLVMR